MKERSKNITKKYPKRSKFNSGSIFLESTVLCMVKRADSTTQRDIPWPVVFCFAAAHPPRSAPMS